MNSFSSQQFPGGQAPGFNNMNNSSMPPNFDSMHPAQIQRMRAMMANGGGGGLDMAGGMGGMSPAMLQQQAMMNGRGNMMNNMNLGGMGDMSGMGMGAGGGGAGGMGMGMGGMGAGMGMGGASSPTNGNEQGSIAHLLEHT